MANSNIVYGVTINGIREKCSVGGVNCSRHYLHDAKQKAKAASDEGLSPFGPDTDAVETISAADYVKSIQESEKAKRDAEEAARTNQWDTRKRKWAEDEGIAIELSNLDFKEQAVYGGLPSALTITATQSAAWDDERKLTEEELSIILDNSLKLVAGVESGLYPANDEVRGAAKWVREELYSSENVANDGEPQLPLKKSKSVYGGWDGDAEQGQIPDSIDRLTSSLKRLASETPKTANAFSNEIEKRTGRPSVAVYPVKGWDAFTSIFRRNR